MSTLFNSLNAPRPEQRLDHGVRTSSFEVHPGRPKSLTYKTDHYRRCLSGNITFSLFNFPTCSSRSPRCLYFLPSCTAWLLLPLVMLSFWVLQHSMAYLPRRPSQTPALLWSTATLASPLDHLSQALILQAPIQGQKTSATVLPLQPRTTFKLPITHWPA